MEHLFTRRVVLSGQVAVNLRISTVWASEATNYVFDRELPGIPVVRDWHVSRFCDVMNGEPVPANWFHRVGIGIRRPTCSREGTLRGAFAASGHRFRIRLRTRPGHLSRAPVLSFRGSSLSDPSFSGAAA